MNTEGLDLWTTYLPAPFSGLRPGKRLPADVLPSEGTVVILARAGRPRGEGYRGQAVVRGGELVGVSSIEAEDLVHPHSAAERRYRRAVVSAGFPDRLKRIVEPAGHDWQAGAAYPADDAGLAHVYCERVRGRQVWLRAVTYVEARALGVTA